MHSFKIAASVALLASLVAAAPKYALGKRATGPATDDPDFKAAIVNTHNAHRRYHGAGKLVWDDELAAHAQKHANNCKFEHSGGPYGENLFAIYPGYQDWNQGSIDAVKSWVYEVKNYDYNKPGFSMNTGHYTQAIWKATTKIGCSWNTVPCKDAAYLLCEYDCGGNVDGGYEENVLPPAW